MADDISLFVSLQSKADGALLRAINQNYNLSEPNGNIKHVDGIVVSMKDWENVSKGLQYRAGSLVDAKRPIHDRQLVVNPDLWHLFRGYESNAQRLMGMKVFSLDARRAFREISLERDSRNKLFRQISELYPTLDREYIKKSLEFQKMAGASFLVSPSPPITSAEYLDSQLNKILEMNKTSRDLIDSGIIDGNLMNILTIDPSIFKSLGARRKLLSAISKTDMLGIKLLNLDTEDISQARELINLIKDIRESGIAKRIYLFNVLEFGYVAFCYGVNTIVMPMGGRWPYIRIRRKPPKTRLGTYYHPIDMVYYTYENIQAETRSQNYRLPCHCKICGKYGRITKIEKEYWNNFRRIHFLLVKNMEISELKTTSAPINSALIDKFSRSKQTVWIPLLEL